MAKDNGTGSYLSDWTIPSSEAEMQSLEKLIKKKIVIKTYDKENKKPVINGEPRNNQNPRVYSESIKRRS